MGGISSEKHTKVADPLKIFGGNTKWTDPLGFYKSEATGPDAAAEAEARRQAQIRGSIDKINQVYDAPGRQQQYADFGKSLTDFYMTDLNRQHGNAGRDLTFALARSGLTGGSAATDANAEQAREYQEGVADISRRAQKGIADLRSADESSRMNLIQLAQSGLTGAEAYNRATRAMQDALGSTSAAARVQGLGDIFGSAQRAKTASETRAAQRRADQYYTSQYQPFYAFGGK
jgi:hypothetical protein